MSARRVAGDAPAGVPLAELVAWADELLDAGSGKDYCPNGLQVDGGERVRRLVTGVSACRDLFTRAAGAGADAVLVHHGLFWEGMPRTLTGVQYRRAAVLFEHRMALVAYHLPLDRHPEVGNNAVAVRRLGLGGIAPFGLFDGVPIGFSGRFPSAVPVGELAERCRRLFDREPLIFDGGPAEVTTVGVISGAAEKGLYEAIDQGLDAFVTGEASEWVMNVAREAGIHFLSAGHYATERLGVQELGRRAAERFPIEVEFVDVPNPV